MRFIQVIIVPILVISCGSVLSKEKNRPKRSLQYFFDGLFSGFNEKSKNAPTSRNSNDHAVSPLVVLTKLSAASIQTKNKEVVKDHLLTEIQLEAKPSQNPIRIQLPKPNATISKKGTKLKTANKTSSYAKAGSLQIPIALESNNGISNSSELSTTTTHITTMSEASNSITTTPTSNVNEQSKEFWSEIFCNKINENLNQRKEKPSKSLHQYGTVFFGIPMSMERHSNENNNYEDSDYELHTHSLLDAHKFLIPMGIFIPSASTNIDYSSFNGIQTAKNKLFTLKKLPVFRLQQI